MKSQCIVTVSLLLTLSACSTPRAQDSLHQNPLAIAECPDLGPVSHKDFGAIVSAYLALIEQYQKCQASQSPQEQKKKGAGGS